MGRWTFRAGEGTYYTTGGSRGASSTSGGDGGFLLLCDRANEDDARMQEEG